jgi:serine/threonine-protein kinase BUR1
LGQGTFGIVYKGRQKKSNRLVAIKRILQRDIDDNYPVTAFREMNVVKVLRHDNIVELLDMVFDYPAPEEHNVDMVSKLGKSFYMVLPYMSFDLTGILQNPEISLDEADNKSIMRQLFEGMHFIHSAGYLHRDIKASNILINLHGLLKIADFGLAREYSGPKPTLETPGGGKQMTEVVMTRWYRAPEVLLGNKFYTTAIDMWACGCVLGELYEKKPILPGKSDIEQAYDIFSLIGEPNDSTMPGFQQWKMTPKLRIKRQRPKIHEKFAQLKVPDEAIRLLTNLLTLNAKTRYTAQKALLHEWFTTDPLPKERINTNFPDCHESDVLKRKEERSRQPPQHQQQQVPQQQALPQQAFKHTPPPKTLPNVPHVMSQGPPQQFPQQGIAMVGYSSADVSRPRNDFIKKPRQKLPQGIPHSQSHHDKSQGPPGISVPPQGIPQHQAQSVSNQGLPQGHSQGHPSGPPRRYRPGYGHDVYPNDNHRYPHQPLPPQPHRFENTQQRRYPSNGPQRSSNNSYRSEAGPSSYNRPQGQQGQVPPSAQQDNGIGYSHRYEEYPNKRQRWDENRYRSNNNNGRYMGDPEY